MQSILELKNRLDNLYNRVVNNNEDVLVAMDELLVEIIKYENLDGYNDEEVEMIVSLISSFTEKANIIYDLLDIKRDNLLTIENLRNEFRMIEMKRFNIVNNYVMGIVKICDVNSFKDNLFNFRNKLYAIPINDDNLLEIAKMKSKIQHYNTEVLEDEELLRLAYSNSN